MPIAPAILKFAGMSLQRERDVAGVVKGTSAAMIKNARADVQAGISALGTSLGDTGGRLNYMA